MENGNFKLRIEKAPQVTREEVIEIFTREGESPRALEIFKKWYDQQYERMVANEITNFEMNWSVGELQLELKLYEMAYTTFEDLGDESKQKKDFDAMQKCYNKAEEIWNVSNGS
jgi:tetratricopeptide (TPR) repeat protein